MPVAIGLKRFFVTAWPIGRKRGNPNANPICAKWISLCIFLGASFGFPGFFVSAFLPKPSLKLGIAHELKDSASSSTRSNHGISFMKKICSQNPFSYYTMPQENQAKKRGRSDSGRLLTYSPTFPSITAIGISVGIFPWPQVQGHMALVFIKAQKKPVGADSR